MFVKKRRKELKKIVALFLAFMVVFSLVSCKSAEDDVSSPKPTAIHTEEPLPENTETVPEEEQRKIINLSHDGGGEVVDSEPGPGMIFFEGSVRNAVSEKIYQNCLFDLSIQVFTFSDDDELIRLEAEKLQKLGYQVEAEESFIKGLFDYEQIKNLPINEDYGYTVHWNKIS